MSGKRGSAPSFSPIGTIEWNRIFTINHFRLLFSIVPSGLCLAWIDFIPIDKSMGYFHIVPSALARPAGGLATSRRFSPHQLFAEP
jgi:hypothetical protein